MKGRISAASASQLLQPVLGEPLGEGQPAFLTLQAACQSQDVARRLKLQTAHLRVFLCFFQEQLAGGVASSSAGASLLHP